MEGKLPNSGMSVLKLRSWLLPDGSLCTGILITIGVINTPVYTLSRNVLNPEDFRYTSTIDTLDIGDSLIIVANLAMRPNPRHPYNGVLSAGSIQLLQDTNLRHHQIRKTWNFQG